MNLMVTVSNPPYRSITEAPYTASPCFQLPFARPQRLLQPQPPGATLAGWGARKKTSPNKNVQSGPRHQLQVGL